MCSGKRPYYLIGVRGFVGTCRLIVAASGVIRTQDNAILMEEETTENNFINNKWKRQFAGHNCFSFPDRQWDWDPKEWKHFYPATHLNCVYRRRSRLTTIIRHFVCVVRSFGPFKADVVGWMHGFVDRRSPMLPCNQNHIDILLIDH